MLAWLPAVAAADDLQDRITLYDAMLHEALTGDLTLASASYRRLARELPVEAPTRAHALLWLGRALYDEGQIVEAREALLDGIRSGLCPVRCRELLELIEVDQESISRIPTTWTFDQADHGVFHPWVVQDLGTIRLAAAPDGDAALAWSTTTQPRKPDRLVVGFHSPFPAPTEVRVAVTSASMDALLQVLVEDDAGRRYGLPDALIVPAGAPRQLVIPLRAMEPVEPSDPPLQAASLSRLTVVDLSGTRATGTNTLWLHDFEVR